MRRQQGFALLIVLWLLVPLSALFLILSGIARSDAQLTGNLRGAAEMQEAADAAINTAIFTLMQQAAQARSGAPGRLAPFTVRLPQADVDVAVASQSALVNPNVASPELLRALLMRVGTPPVRAESVAAAMIDWRTPGQRARPNGAKAAEYRAAGLDYGPPGAPFETLGEIRDVLGMTPAMAAALTPYLTLYAEREPDPDVAPPVVRAALGDLGVRGRGGEDGGEIVSIVAAAHRDSGARVVRRAVVKIGFSANRRGWRVLSWDTAPG